MAEERFADRSAGNNHPFGRGAPPGARSGTVLRPSCSTNDCGSYFSRRRAMTVRRWDRVCLVGVGVLVACGGGGDGGGTGPCTPGAATHLWSRGGKQQFLQSLEHRRADRRDGDVDMELGTHPAQRDVHGWPSAATLELNDASRGNELQHHVHERGTVHVPLHHPRRDGRERDRGALRNGSGELADRLPERVLTSYDDDPRSGRAGDVRVLCL